MSEARTSYVLQYEGRGSGDWVDVSARSTPEEAFKRLDLFRATWASWNDLNNAPQSDTPDFQVVRRVITDTAIADPRLAPEAEEAKAVSS